jgi:hypothetical protein
MGRDFRKPDGPPAFTGTMWKNDDGTIGMEITDVFLYPIHIIGVRDGSEYYLRGWRGEPPNTIRIPLVDDPT